MSLAVDVREHLVKEPGATQHVDATGWDLRSANARIREAMAGGRVEIHGANHLHGLVGAARSGEAIIEGDCGDYLAVLNRGAAIHVQGSVGSYVADNMTHGTVVVDGDAGRAAAPYCYGGTVVVRGNAGDFAAVMNKGATVIIGGNVGDEVATYMLDGDVVILGNAGKNLGNYLIRGSIYIAGTWETLGHNTRLEAMSEADAQKLHAYFEQYGIKADPAAFTKIVRLSEKPFYKASAKAQAHAASK